MIIEGKKIILRAIEEEDLPLLHRWANSPEIWYQLGGWHFPGSMDYMKNWFYGLRNDNLNQRFAIEARDVGLIGTANLLDIDWKNNHAFHGMVIGNTDVRGKGYGTDVLTAIMRYAFEELHFERLDGSIIEYNKASLGLYLGKCGWKEEGRQKRWYFRSNKYWDRIIVGITREDYVKFVHKKKP